MSPNIHIDSATTVVACFFESQKAAFKTLVSLRECGSERPLQSAGVIDATVMREGPHGSLCIDRTIEPPPGSSRWLDEVFAPAILGWPANRAEDDDVVAHFSAHRLQINPVREIADNLPPDGAALVILLEEEWIDEFRRRAEGDAEIERWPLVI